MSERAGAKPPIACELSPGELELRRAALLPGLVEHAVRREELADGFRWRFEPEPGLLGRIAAVVEAERNCCRFLRFRLEIEPDGGAFSLEVTGPDGTAAFLSRWAGA
ncbi:MAG: hypothetical protein ACREKI_04980 [Gemmatimonadota bacterium]